MPLIIAAWIMRTLMDSAGSDRPRRKALVGRELGKYKVEIAALSETRLAEEGLSSGVDAWKKSGVKQKQDSPSSPTLSVSSQNFQKA